MRSERFQQYCLTALAKGPDIQAVEPWSNTVERPMGLALTTVAAPGQKLDQTEIPVTGEKPAEIPLPDLYEDGKISPARAELYLAALLTNGGSEELLRASGYSGRPVPAMHPGVGVEFHSGGKANLPFAHTARSDKQFGGKPFLNLHSEF
ncbi:hypothetical protein [Streptomyces sp. NBC_01465]|uniref:hypothetical protein n=1 Tax=Streptomyces sp. NBC_01465 TaxID=2903878 RepID=UPI002E31C9D6|nr:hypothetical protein [Streptomyces sp. NBC_01465]